MYSINAVLYNTKSTLEAVSDCTASTAQLFFKLNANIGMLYEYVHLVHWL